jgi:hypothetical protein
MSENTANQLVMVDRPGQLGAGSVGPGWRLGT